jgi:hypothetical protein
MVPVYHTPLLDHHGRLPYDYRRRVEDHGRPLHNHRRRSHNDGGRCRNDRHGYRQLNPNRYMDTPCVR